MKTVMLTQPRYWKLLIVLPTKSNALANAYVHVRTKQLLGAFSQCAPSVDHFLPSVDHDAIG